MSGAARKGRNADSTMSKEKASMKLPATGRKPSRQAGDHPFEYGIDFGVDSYEERLTSSSALRNGLIRTVEVTLPRGLISNPQLMPKCDPTKFVERRSTDLRFWRRVCPWLAIVIYTISGLLATAPAAASVGPLYDVKATWGDTNLPPGGEGEFILQVRDVGDAVEAKDLTVSDRLPAGVHITGIKWETYLFGSTRLNLSTYCSGDGPLNAENPSGIKGAAALTCVVPGGAEVGSYPLLPLIATPFPGPNPLGGFANGYLPELYITVRVDEAATGTAANLARVEGGGGPAFNEEDRVAFSASPSGFGVVPGSFSADFFDAAYPLGSRVRQAGAHPFELRLAFDLDAEAPQPNGELPPHGLVRTARISLPRGLIADPEALPRCSAADLANEECPPDTQVGYLNLSASNTAPLSHLPLYNVVPPSGEPADFAFSLLGLVSLNVFPTLDPTHGYATEVVIPYITGQVNLRSAEVTLWGVPGDPAHDRFRRYQEPTFGRIFGAPFGSAPIRPLFTNPMDCGTPNGAASIRVDSYEHPQELTAPQESPEPLNVTGCGDPRFSFEPTLALQPTDHRAAAPSGLDLRLSVPQRDDEAGNAEKLYAQSGEVAAIPTPPIRRAVITLPQGATINPSLAQGLAACTEAEIGLLSEGPPRFDAAQPACPESSRIGSLEATTPLLSQPLTGSIYLAEQGRNPFHSLLALYLVIEESERGLLIKIPARLDLDPRSGQITVTLDDMPQLPFSDLTLHLKGGSRGVLRLPETCGAYTAQYELTSWSSPSPVPGAADFTIEEGCPDGAFRPVLAGGTINPIAGAPSPLVVELTREDAEQRISDFSIELPSGLSAAFAGVPLCPPAAAVIGDCPPASRLGSVAIAAGSGPSPLWFPQLGAPPTAVYLAGPYEGAPFSLVVVVPAQAGPLDLGTVLERAAIYLDPGTAQATVHFDPLPQILQGIPLDYRTIYVKLDRPGFIFNPTNCKRMAVTAAVLSTTGAVANVFDRFQVMDCAALPFRPQLRILLSGALGRTGHPALRAILRPRRGDANLAAARLTLPPTELLDEGHIRAICGGPELAQGSCPAGSIVGRVKAWSPILDRPLQGPLYMRESARRLPDLAADLHGQVHVTVTGRTGYSHGALQVSFPRLPDVPLSKVVIVLAGGRRGLLVNSEPTCATLRRATVRMVGQNGKVHDLSPLLREGCAARRSR